MCNQVLEQTFDQKQLLDDSACIRICGSGQQRKKEQGRKSGEVKLVKRLLFYVMIFKNYLFN
jgi:hypothetical protein